MTKSPPVLTQTHLTTYLRGFARAGYEPHRAVAKRDSVTLFFNPDLPDEACDDESATPEASFDKWKAKRDAG